MAQILGIEIMRLFYNKKHSVDLHHLRILHLQIHLITNMYPSSTNQYPCYFQSLNRHPQSSTKYESTDVFVSNLSWNKAAPSYCKQLSFSGSI